MAKWALGTLAPELLGLNVYARPDCPLEIHGAFADTVDEAEGGLLSCNPSPGSFPRDEPPTLNFRALLAEGGAERLELARG